MHANPAQLRALVEENLEQLGVDTLDLCYLRVGGAGPDPAESIGERFAALAAVQNQFGVLDQSDGPLVDECAAAGIVSRRSRRSAAG